MNQIRTFQPEDETAVIALWRACGLTRPWNNPHLDIQRKLAEDPSLFFVVEEESRIIGSCMAGYDGHRGWIYYLAVHPEAQKRGLATQLMRHAEEKLIAQGCPKLELMVRDTNAEVIDFYNKIGYQQDPVVVLTRRLIEDAPYEFAEDSTAKR